MTAAFLISFLGLNRQGGGAEGAFLNADSLTILNLFYNLQLAPKYRQHLAKFYNIFSKAKNVDYKYTRV